VISVCFTSIGYFNSFRPDGSNKMYFYDYLSITVVPMSICIMLLLKRFTAPIGHPAISSRLALLSFGVYLIHPAVLSSLIFLGIKPELYNSLVSIPALTVLIFLVSLVLSLIITKIPLLKMTI
jgi:surface polysaccharide O-acyltransferase-like enzyme